MCSNRKTNNMVYNNSHKTYLVFIIGFLIYFYFDATCFSAIQAWGKNNLDSKAIGHVLAYSLTIVPLILTVSIINAYNKIIESLGLKESIIKGFIFSLICTLPMLVGFYFNYPLDRSLGWNTIFINTISSAFFEEVIFRGFLFGQLYRFTKLGFLPSILLSSCLFGLAHLYQSTDVLELMGVFAITFLGSVLFSWIYAEWNFNLWASIFIHCLMNLFWLIFSAGDNALGGVYANIFRAISLVLIILVTVLYKKQKGLAMEVNTKSIWLKKHS